MGGQGAGRDAEELIREHSRRADDRFVKSAISHAQKWAIFAGELTDVSLVGLFVASEQEMERRGLKERPPRK